MLASSYPLLDIFLSMLWFFLFFLWIWLLIIVFADIFRSHDMGGGAKALWVIFIILVPFLGVLIYLIARGGKMAERSQRDAQAQQKAFDDYVRQTASTATPAEQLSTLSQLHDQGKLSDADYEAAKAKVLSS
jgi:hypothetical protein